MIKELYQEICDGREVRANLIALRRELKEDAGQRAFAYLLGGDFRELTRLLKSDDPKIRKNAALILGEMETEDILPFLFAAYQTEETLFVRPAYLKAMEKLDFSPVLDKLKARMEELMEAGRTVENQKHLREELQQLQTMIRSREKTKKHKFIGYEPSPEVILVTNRIQKAAVKAQISTGTVSELGQGLRVKGGNLKELMELRTYTELLFPISGARVVSGSPEELGKALAGPFADFLEDHHQSGGCFYYRIELKSAQPLEKKGDFVRKLAESLDLCSAGRLWNTAESYEAELRLLERKDGSYVPLVKLYTLPDRRFSYRREAVAASISPVNAALIAELARPYLKEGAQILDPFCGVGTMLVERTMAVKADPIYGVDIFGEAIEKARRNTQRAGMTIHYINRDFFDFSHEYLFDEIITDMPRAGRGEGEEPISEVYHHFFRRAPHFLKEGGIMILYTMDPKLVEKELKTGESFRKEKEFLINEKNDTRVYILRLN